MARQRKGREVNGILLLDKPSGITSNRALQRAKNLFFARKAGHTGSLDPLASGVLPVCFGHATKISGFLLDAHKVYQVSCALGVATDTGDSEGQVIEQTTSVPNLPAIEQVLPQFNGDIEQVPPMYSALKQDGTRLYSLARQGKVVDRPARTVTIYSIDEVALSDNVLSMVVKCSKGTYIRTLMEDIAKAAGSLAHVVALRRTEAGPFNVDNVTSLAAIEQLVDESKAEDEDGGWTLARERLDALLQPIDSAISHWPAVHLDEDSGFYLLNGQAVQAVDAPREGLLRLYVDGRGLVGLGEVLPDGRVTPKRLFR